MLLSQRCGWSNLKSHRISGRMLGSSSRQPKARLRRYIWTDFAFDMLQYQNFGTNGFVRCCLLQYASVDLLYLSNWRVPLSSEWSPNSHYYVQFHTLIPSHKFGSLSMYLIFCFSVYIVLFTLNFNPLPALSDWFLFGSQAGKHLQVSRRPTRQGWCDRKWKGFDRVPKKGKTLASQGSDCWWCWWIG